MSAVFEHASHAELNQQEWDLHNTQIKLLVFYQALSFVKRGMTVCIIPMQTFCCKIWEEKKGCQVM